MSTPVTLIPGDGIGPEITDAVLRILEAAGADVEFETVAAGASAMETHGTPLPEGTVASIRRNKIALKGPLTTPVGAGFRSVNVALRQEFDLYVNLRPVRTLWPGARYKDVDLVIIRENTEGLYCGVESWHAVDGDPHGQAESVMRVTREGARRIANWAFAFAEENGRRKVTLAHKANILKHTQGLMLQEARRAAEAPGRHSSRVRFEDRIVDAMCMDLVLDPSRHDVIFCENLFGDLLSDLAAGLVGGLGLAPGANLGDEYAIFEAVHGSAPDIAGKGVANPTSLLLSATMMLSHIGGGDVAERIDRAVWSVLQDGTVLTGDLGGTATTQEYADAIIARLQ